MAKLLTDWIKVATSGPTVDGREIAESWLVDIAETYSRKEYAARIFASWDSETHDRDLDLGMVDAVKAETDDQGRLSLYAQFEPNADALWLAQHRQLFASIEVDTSMRPDGRAYLAGIAFVKDPASWATEQLKFNRRRRKHNFSALLKTRVRFAKKPTKHAEETQMDEELKAQLDQILAAITTLTEAVSQVLTKQDEVAEVVEEVADEVVGEGGEHRRRKHSADTDRVTDVVEKFTSVVDGLKEQLEKSGKRERHSRSNAGGKPVVGKVNI